MELLERIKNTAYCSGSRTAYRSMNGSITYSDLWELSGNLAKYLQELIPPDKRPIVVYGHKSPMMLVCFLACVRSGHPYCPVDISIPIERLYHISEMSGNSYIIAPEITNTDYLGSRYHVIDRQECERAVLADVKDATDLVLDGEELFYIIFTSGSTGRPKGVPVTCGNLDSYLQWSSGLTGGIPEGSVFFNQASFSFDLSVMDLFTGLYTGGTIVAMERQIQQDPVVMMHWFINHPIEYWVSTPSFAELCLANPEFNSKLLNNLKAFLFCGEPLIGKTAGTLLHRFPQAKIINTYGPTESTVCVTSVEITQEMVDMGKQLPVGRPKPGTEIRIDPKNKEILILGDTVCPGYYKNPQQTEKAFFSETEKTLSGRVIRGYRTGDAGHFDSSGLLYCDGRLDQQIKLHGYRIELNDIEWNLRKIDGIRQAAVLPICRKERTHSLCAFVVADGQKIHNGFSGRKQIRERLGEKLPSYMIPKKVLFLKELPLTANNKVDRKKLERML